MPLPPHDFLKEGASHLFPDRWDAYVAPIPEAERHDLITAYRKRLVGTDDEVCVFIYMSSKWVGGLACDLAPKRMLVGVHVYAYMDIVQL